MFTTSASEYLPLSGSTIHAIATEAQTSNRVNDKTDGTHTSREILRANIDDVFLILVHATDRGVALEPDLLAKVIAADRAEREGTLTPQQEADFWLAAAMASRAILPVTPESVRCSVAHGEHSAAGRAARKYRVRTLVTLAALLLFQVYWLVGATILNDIDEIKGRLTTLGPEHTAALKALDRFDSHSPDFAPDNPNFAAERSAAQARFDSVDGKVTVERVSVATDLNMLRNWNIANTILLWSRPAAPVAKIGRPG